jgi:DNA topoisomerase-1
MKYLSHNGVMIPASYDSKGLHIVVKGTKIKLDSEQEEMAVAFAKKFGTEYIEDKVFVKNFLRDFSKKLGINEPLNFEDIDFSEVTAHVEHERELKLNLNKEEKKRAAEARKAIREANKEKYGFAIVDGERVEIGNYVAEPSSIFMGRGKHPMRGKWKEGPKAKDITLNLSPDTTVPAGQWKNIIWEPKFMWIAKWDDKLNNKEKYIWLADTSSVKQQREKEKFDHAKDLQKSIELVREHISSNLTSTNLKRRKIATVCYLIDALSLRVGDEKDRDEADTVGATTLRPSHIKFVENDLVTFDFLGKDSVRWYKQVKLPISVIENLKEFIKESNSALFNGIRSDVVSQFLGEAVPYLTAKVFRTYHATKTVNEYLMQHKVKKSDPEYEKKHVATLANLQAAIICNHKRKLPKTWSKSLERKKERLKKLKNTKKKTNKTLQSIAKTKLDIERSKATRDYNLQTSLKSYIDPRLYRSWGNKINYDWKLYYSKTLQRKFSWIDGHKSSDK